MKTDTAIADILRRFERHTGLLGVTAETKERSDGTFIVIHVGNPSERFYRIIKAIEGELPEQSPFRGRITLRKTPPETWLSSREAHLFQRSLSERLTVGQESLTESFFDRYIPSVIGAEAQIEGAVNHIVFGRRGSGKSSLLVYAAKKLDERSAPYAWVSMQTYEQRDDEKVTIDVLLDILGQLGAAIGNTAEVASLRRDLTQIETQGTVTPNDIRQVLPRVKRVLVPTALSTRGLTVFVDDLHLLSQSFQAQFLSHLYAFSRGNRISLKISSIEGLTRNWDPTKRIGLEVPNDAQAIRLDYNLTMPDKARQHIGEILDINAQYCGLPSVGTLCGTGVIDRLAWVSAGVPRDAIYVLLQSMSKAAAYKRKRIAIADINTAASEAADDKLRSLQQDAGGELKQIQGAFERVTSFCQAERKNAFLVEIRNQHEAYSDVMKLVDLRLLHVLSPGITPHKAGKRYVALLLDYGLYVGIRTARSIELIQKEPKALTSKELRNLPRLEL